MSGNVLDIYTLTCFTDHNGKHEEIIGRRQFEVTLVTHTQCSQYRRQEPQTGVPQAVVSLWLLVTYKNQQLRSVALLLIEF